MSLSRKDITMKHKKFLYPCILAAFTLFLMYLTVPGGYLFGSNTDWFSQHVGIADYFRKTFYEQGTLFPDYSVLGAGSNFYSYAYYGYLRPDILIGCLLPMISMKYIIIAYSIAGVTAAVLLFYLFLRRHEMEPFYCFLGGLFFACSNCFFQAHMQIMFVNYLPFLLLALLCIDRMRETGKMGGLILSLFFIYLHSFYFSISCIAVCFLYLWTQGMNRASFLRFLIGVCVSISMAGVLLLPTAYVLLENKKDAGVTYLYEILGVNPTLKTLLYSRYGCGVSLTALYTLFLGIRRKDTRRLSVILFLCMTVNLVSYLLNGTLYVRGKILIPFLPLILLLCTQILRELLQGRDTHSLFLYGLCLLPFVFQKPNTLMLLDAALLLSFVIFPRKRVRPALSLILVLAPALLYIQTGRTDLFVPAQDKRQTLFSSEEIAEVYQDQNSRFDCLVEPLANVNYLSVPWARKSSVYSSTTNTLYSRFFYDIMKNTIRINNRVALLPDANPFFESLMGVRYLETHKDKVPYGYQILKEKTDADGSYVLAENPNVQPLAYASFQLMGEEAFDRLEYPYTLDTIANNTIIPQKTDGQYSSQISPVSSEELFDGALSVKHTRNKDQSLTFHLSEETTCVVPLKTSMAEKILLLSFEVESLDGKEVSISINHSKNKLSDKNAPYPNRNQTFYYILSSNQDWDSLKVTFSAGRYSLRNLKIYQMDGKQLGNRSTIPAVLEETEKKEVLKGTITLEQDGYFVTSLPYQKGYTALVDGEVCEIQVVNKAFVGFPLKKGSHEITLLFHAPWKKAGILFSVIGWGGFLLLFYRGKRPGAHSR